MQPRSSRWPLAVLLGQVLLFFRHVLFSPRYTIPWDFRYYHFPLAEIMARSLARGEFPLWDPSTYCGRPFYAMVTAQVFYPPALATALLANLAGGRQLQAFLEVQLVIHVLLAGLFTYGLLRSLRLGTGAALTGATVYQLGAYFASQTQHLGAVEAAAWMPLAWHAVVLLGRGFSWRRITLLAAALAMSFLAGFTATTMAVFASVLLLAMALAAMRLAPLKVVLWSASGLAVAGMLCAIQIVPATQLTGLSVAGMRYQWAGTGSGVPLEALTTLVAPNHLGVWDFHTKGWAPAWNPTFTYLYCGILTLLFALVAVARPRREGVVFAFLTVVFALWMLGNSTPVGRAIFPLLPGTVRGALYLEFGMAAFVLSLAALAAIGFETLLAGRSRLLQAMAVLAVTADLLLANSGRPINTADKTMEAGVTYEQMDGEAAAPRALRQLTGRSTPPSRIDNLEGSPTWTGCAPLFGVDSANGDDPFALVRFLDVRLLFSEGVPWSRFYMVSRPASPVLDLLNVEYLVSRRTTGPPGLKRQEQHGPVVIYRNPGALPRFFLVARAHHAANFEEALAYMRQPAFDPHTEAVVEGATAPQLSAAGTVRLLRYGAREIALETESPGAALLVSSEAWYPGWRAWIDGRERPVLLTNAAFRGLALPGGKHAVRLRFDPPLLWPAAALSAAILAALLSLCALRDNKQKRVAWTSSSSSSLP